MPGGRTSSASTFSTGFSLSAASVFSAGLAADIAINAPLVWAISGHLYRGKPHGWKKV